MAIKKRPVSPRQKMINLMYVILMAMLALNTPTDEEFGVKGKSIVEKIKKSLADDGKKSDEEKKNIDLVELTLVFGLLRVNLPMLLIFARYCKS